MIHALCFVSGRDRGLTVASFSSSYSASGVTTLVVKFTWTAPACIGTTCLSQYVMGLTQYALLYNAGGSTSTAIMRTNSTGATFVAEFVMTPLTAVTPFFQVAAVNMLGIGVATSALQLYSVAPAAPTAFALVPQSMYFPTNLTVTLSVSWTTPCNGQVCAGVNVPALTGYKIAYSAGVPLTTTLTTGDTGSSALLMDVPITVATTGLTLSLTAINLIGASPAVVLTLPFVVPQVAPTYVCSPPALFEFPSSLALCHNDRPFFDRLCVLCLRVCLD